MLPGRRSDALPFLSRLVQPSTETAEAAATSWKSDLELMHHFTAVTWRTLPQADEIGNIWQLELPRLAMGHDFLMHQLLAVAAAHMAYLHQQKGSVDTGLSYGRCAALHQNSAVRDLGPTLKAIDDANLPAVFLTMSLLSVSAFPTTSSATRPNGGPGVTELLDVMVVLRGMHSVLAEHHAELEASPIVGRMLQLGQYETDSQLLDELTDELTIMLRLLSMEDGVARSSRDTYLRGTVEDFMHWIRHACDSVQEPEVRLAMTWPARLANGFLDLVARRDAGALKVVRGYCRILEALGSTCWYLEGWGERALVDIDRAMSC
jgi:hypothetical protein